MLSRSRVVLARAILGLLLSVIASPGSTVSRGRHIPPLDFPAFPISAHVKPVLPVVVQYSVSCAGDLIDFAAKWKYGFILIMEDLPRKWRAKMKKNISRPNKSERKILI